MARKKKIETEIETETVENKYIVELDFKIGDIVRTNSGNEFIITTIKITQKGIFYYDVEYNRLYEAKYLTYVS